MAETWITSYGSTVLRYAASFIYERGHTLFRVSLWKSPLCYEGLAHFFNYTASCWMSIWATVAESTRCLYTHKLWLLGSFPGTETFVELTAHNWQKWKRVFLTCPCHEIYGHEAVGLKSCKYTWKITIFVKMCNLGQYRENLLFCQQLINWSSNLKILLHMCDTYNYNYLKYSTFRFNLIDFQLNTYFPSQFCVFYRKIT